MERTGANQNDPATSETLRRWRQSRGWDKPRLARELRKAARDTGEGIAVHHALVKMIGLWERGSRAPRERYQLLYRKVFEETPGGTDEADLMLRAAEARSHAASLPGSGEIEEMGSAAMERGPVGMTPAEIRATVEETIATLNQVTGTLAELAELLGDEDQP